MREPIALVGVTIVDVLTSRCDDDQAVVIDGTRIAAVGPAADVVIPADAHRRELPGRWVLPGLIDMHCHVTNRGGGVPLELFLANGVTTARDPGGRIGEQRLLGQQVRDGERVGPRLKFAGEFLDGNPPVWPQSSHIVDTPERGAAAVRHLAAQGADLIKIYNHVPEDVLITVLKVAAEAGLPVTGHVPRAMSMRHAIEVGMTDLEHIRITGSDFLPPDEARELDGLPVGEREPRLWARIELDDPWVADLIALLAERRIVLDPTLLIDDVAYDTGFAGEAEHEDNRYLPIELRDEWRARAVSPLLMMPAELRELGLEANRKRREFVRRCAAAGVHLVTGTDGAGCGRLLPGFGIHHELELFRLAGLDAFTRLRAATIGAAEALRMGDELGSVTPGKLADLGVWTADPCNTSLRPDDLELVVVDGVAHAPADLVDA